MKKSAGYGRLIILVWKGVKTVNEFFNIINSFLKRKGGTSRAIKVLTAWAVVLTILIMALIWIIPKKKRYSKLWRIANDNQTRSINNQDKVKELERIWASRSVF